MDYGLWQNPLNQPAARRIDDPPTASPPQQDALPPTTLADFHFLYLAPGLGMEYFFDASRQYWTTFKVIVLHDLDVVRHVPRQYSVAITSLARSDTAQFVRDDIESRFGNRVFHDPLVYDFVEDLQLTLNVRAERNEPFGVPLTNTSE